MARLTKVWHCRQSNLRWRRQEWQDQIPKWTFPEGQSVRNQEKSTWNGDGLVLSWEPTNSNNRLSHILKQTTTVLVITTILSSSQGSFDRDIWVTEHYQAQWSPQCHPSDKTQGVTEECSATLLLPWVSSSTHLQHCPASSQAFPSGWEGNPPKHCSGNNGTQENPLCRFQWQRQSPLSD